MGEHNGNDFDDDSHDGCDYDSDREFHPAMIPAYVREHEYGHRYVSDDDDDDDYMGMFGFDDEDCFELLCQGIKPWDACAGAALAVIYGGDIDF